MGWLVAAAGALIGLVAAAWWMRRHLLLVAVSGSSMEPTLYAGDRILVRRRPAAQLRRGDIVVLDPPDVMLSDGAVTVAPIGGHQVKRLAALPGEPWPAGVPGQGVVPDGAVVVLSDNPYGVDSRRWGPYPADGVIGVMVRRTRVAPRTERV